MVVAAANRNWLPQLLGVIGQLGRPSSDQNNSLGSDAPINAIVLSTILPIFYILFGNFRALLTFNGLGEYSFFFLTVVGAIMLRFREPDLERPYKPFLGIPIVFVLVSGFVVTRGAVFAPFQAAILIVLWVIGAGFYALRKRWLKGGQRYAAVSTGEGEGEAE